MTLLPLMRSRSSADRSCVPIWLSYTGIAAKGYVLRLVEHGKGEYWKTGGNHKPD